MILKGLTVCGVPPLSGPAKMLMHSRILVHCYDVLWRRWTVSKCAVWSDSIVVMSPSFN